MAKLTVKMTHSFQQGISSLLKYIKEIFLGCFTTCFSSLGSVYSVLIYEGKQGESYEF